MLRIGYLVDMVYLNKKPKAEWKVGDVAIVQKFPNVFLDILPGLMLDRKIEVTIDLEPGSVLVFKAPYRMATNELEELKVQLQELLDLGFIRPSVSP